MPRHWSREKTKEIDLAAISGEKHEKSPFAGKRYRVVRRVMLKPLSPASEKDHRRAERRIFLTSLVVSLCVLLLILGILETDHQCRRIGFGDGDTLIRQITGKDGSLLDFLKWL